MNSYDRELTIDERFKWGDCPTCGAKHGEPCDSRQGIPLGRNVHGEVPKDGIHLSRLRAAPTRIRQTPLHHASPQVEKP